MKFKLDPQSVSGLFQLNIVLPYAVKEKLDAIAQRSGMKKSAIAQQMIEHCLSELPEEPADG